MSYKLVTFPGGLNIISMSLSSGRDPWGRNTSAITGSWITGSISESIGRFHSSTDIIDDFGKQYIEEVLAQPTSSFGWGINSLTASNEHIIKTQYHYDNEGNPISQSRGERYEAEITYKVTLPENWRTQNPNFEPDEL
jgi:hypothetical protein